MAETKSERASPAYMPWRTFINFINTLRNTGLPSQVNRSVMTNLSYSSQAQLLAGLRFLKLIDATGQPTAILQRLIATSEGDQREVVAEIIRDCYQFAFDKLDLSRATPDELEKQFREKGITGSTAARAAAFFLEAAEAAGVTLSAHLKKKNGVSTGSAPRTRSSRKRVRAVASAKSEEGSQQIPGAIGMSFEGQLLDKFPTFDPTWPDPIKQQWFEGFQKLMGMAPTKKVAP